MEMSMKTSDPVPRRFGMTAAHTESGARERERDAVTLFRKFHLHIC